MKKIYLTLFVCLFSLVLLAQHQHERRDIKSIPREEIKKACQFFKGDTLEGFRMDDAIDEASAKLRMYPELIGSMHLRENAFVKKKYNLQILPGEHIVQNPSFSYRGGNSIPTSSCNNLDFENGNFTGWTGAIGYNANTNTLLTVTAGGINTLGTNSPEPGCSFHTIISAPYGNDPYGGFPGVDPGGGNFACRLGGSLLNLNCDAYNSSAPNYPLYLGPNVSSCRSNTNSGTNAYSNGETIRQTFPVTTANCLFSYSYAVVMADAPHLGGQNPYFSVRVFDQSGNLIPCLSYFVEADTTGAGGVPPGFSVSSSLDALGNSVLYTNWTKNSLNLQPYIGTNVTVEFTAAGCIAGGHFCYAYVDCACGPLQLIVPSGEVCKGGTETLTAPANAGGTYSWSGPGIVSGGTSQTITLNQPGTYSVTLTNGKGCKYTIDTTVAFYPTPTVTVNNPTVCPGNTVTLNATSTGGAGALSYTWTPSTGLSVTNDSTTTATVNGTTSYTVTAISIHNCTNTAVATITVPPAATPVFSAPAVCLGAPTIINNTTGGTGTFNWNFGDGSAVVTNQYSPQHTYTTTGSFVVTATVNVGGCVASSSNTVVVNPNPTVTVNNATICNGSGPVTLTAAGANTYTWNTGATNASISVNPAATTSYTVTGSTAAGCVNTATTSVTVISNPTVTATSSSVCVGTTATLTASGATTYQWSGPNLVTNTGATTNANPTTTSTYTVVGTIGTCTASTIATVTVNPNPTVTATSSSVCAGTTATLTANGATTYQWSGPNLISNTGATTNANPGATSTYTVVGTVGTCTGSATVTVTVNPNPTVTVNNATICNGSGPVTLTAAGANTYTWNTGATNASISVNPAATTSYTVTGSTAAGCVNTATTSVTVISNPTVTATSSSVCVGTTATLTASGATTYQWSGPNLVTSTGATTNANPTTTSTYTVVGTIGTCTASTTATVTVNPNPVPAFTDNTVCQGTPTPFNNTSTPAGSNYNWDFGDGNTSTSTSPSNTYSASGTYVVTLTVITTAGCAGTVTNTAMVKPNPTLSPVSNISVCSQQQVSVPAFVSNPGGATINWTNSNTTIGLAASGSGNIASFTGTTNGSLTPLIGTVTATPTLNGCTGPPITFNITVLPQPTITVAPPNPYCPGDTVFSPNITSNPAGSTYTWMNNNTQIGLGASGSGVPPMFAAQPNPNFTGANVSGVITVTPSLNGCVGQPASYTVNVKPTPIPSPTTSLEYCPNVSTVPINFVSSPPGASFFWTATNTGIGISASGGGTISSFTTVNTGSTAVSSNVTITADLNGCAGPSAIFTITINPNPKALFSANNKVCLGAPMNFFDLSSVGTGAITTWAWDLDGATAPFSTIQNPQSIILTAGSHSITLNVTTNKGCTATVTEPVYINYIPTALFTGGGQGCPNLTVANFTDGSSVTGPATIASWSWNMGNGATSNTHNPGSYTYGNTSPTQAAVYTISLVVTSDSGCVSLAYAKPCINVYPRPKAGFTWGPTNPQPDIFDPTIHFYDQSIGASGSNGLTWNLGDVYATSPTTNGPFTNNPNPIHIYGGSDNSYTYTATQWVQNSYGCRDSISEPVPIAPIWTFYIPNAFTPNGDGTNDGWKGVGIGIDQATYNLWVFDRWGNMIFYTNDMEHKWDGRVRGQGDIVQEDVYVWKVGFHDYTGMKHEYKGTVSVVK